MFFQGIREYFGRFEFLQPKFRIVKEKLGTRVEFRLALGDPFLEEIFNGQTIQGLSPFRFRRNEKG
jgi:hypothetical protein